MDSERIARLRALIQERIDAAEKVARDPHSQERRTAYVMAYTLFSSAMGPLKWKYRDQATPVVETEWSSMANWKPDRWRQFLADERETAAAAMRSLDRAP